MRLSSCKNRLKTLVSVVRWKYSELAKSMTLGLLG
jgi:hypothetical protein